MNIVSPGSNRHNYVSDVIEIKLKSILWYKTLRCIIVNVRNASHKTVLMPLTQSDQIEYDFVFLLCISFTHYKFNFLYIIYRDPFAKLTNLPKIS